MDIFEVIKIIIGFLSLFFASKFIYKKISINQNINGDNNQQAGRDINNDK